MRTERTVADGALNAKSKVSGQDTVQQVSNRYLDFFPSLHLTWKTNDHHSFSLSYNQKIDRPTYADLNPFEYQMDELSSWKGNSFLRPQYANSVTLGYNATGVLAATVSYTRIQDMFVSVTDSIDGNKMIIMPQNVGTQQLFSLHISSAVEVMPWWNITASAGFFHKQNHISYDVARAVTLHVNTMMLNLQQVFELDRKTQLEVSGYYNSPDLTGGFQRTKFVWQVNTGVQRKVLRDKGVVKLGISDLFQTYCWAGIRDYDGMYYRNQGAEDSRQLKLGFNYRFGNVKIARERDRSSGLDSESRRVK
ncbi:hypothetical protein UNH65_07020 [Chitinophaga sp. 180180018-2]|nr:hypothetical protein [Chitinophaga sp. 212800010-3]